MERRKYTPAPRDAFERRIRKQFGLSDAAARAIAELRYQGAM